MAEFSKLITTNSGLALLSKLLAGDAIIEFTKIALSSRDYTDISIEELTSLDYKQIAPVSNVTRLNSTSIKIEGAFTNTEITDGYYIRAVGLYALDPDLGEILYSVAIETSGNCYMPSYNNTTASSVYLQLITTISNSENVSLNVNQAAVATVGDIRALEREITDIRGFIGYNESDIYGVEVDLKNKRITRLAGAANLSAGADFDKVKSFGGRRRCNLTNDGKVTAYYGEPRFVSSGKDEQGNAVQVMVEQPKYYYKVVPIDLEIIKEGGNQGYHIRKARYYISETPKPGFKIHPAFVGNGKINDFIYLAAFEGSLWDSSAGEYILDDAQVADFAIAVGAGDMLSSISKAKPISGNSQNLTRKNVRLLSENRGAGWGQSHAATIAASQLLMLIEYASFDMQSVIGDGNINKNPSTSNVQCTGLTDSLGNSSGKEVDAVSYRGEENLWGNVWTWVDGLNCQNPAMFATKKVGALYVSTDTLNDDTSASPYEDTGIHPCYSGNAYISSFGYSEKFDWLFIPTECNGNSSLPVGDGMLNNSSGWRTIAMGGYCANSSNAGAFCLTLTPSSVYKSWTTGGRLVYIPSKGGTEK